MNEPIAKGGVEALCVNGVSVGSVLFENEGPESDSHSGFARTLSGHDGGYTSTSDLARGSEIFNWRSWTGVSNEETSEIEDAIVHSIPTGCLLENITVSGIPNFSNLPPTSRLVFPMREVGGQAILAVWGRNEPCSGVGRRLEDYHGIPGLSTEFIRAARGKRGVMGFVLSAGQIKTGDTILVYPPVQ